MLAVDREAIHALYALNDHALELDAAGQRNAARDLVTQGRPTVTAATDALKHHRQYNMDLGVAAAARAAGIKQGAARMEIGIGIAVTAALLIVAFLVIRSILRQLGGEPAAVAAVANRVALGDFTSPITLSPGDTRSLFASVSAMQHNLRVRDEEARQRADADRARAALEQVAAAENARIRAALDRVSVGVMMADVAGTIIYANDFVLNIFRTRRADFRTQWPQFDPERIVGSSFDAFHRAPDRQRGLLARLDSPHITEIRMGKATLRLIANPVSDATGARIGTVLQWIDRTEEVATEEEVAHTVAGALEGNLTLRIREEDKQGFFRTLAAGMNRLVANMADVLRTISAAAAEVSTGAREISRGNADLSQRTEEQASSLEETASSMEQMTSAVRNNADNAAQANQLARAARDQAEQGGNVVHSAVAAMGAINESSRKIADIIGVIDDIAFQTNLLALNAAVEAARAGDLGRGFAVVASEVRTLASRSASAARQVKTLIQESVARVDDGSKLVDASGQVLQNIVKDVKKVTDMVAEIAASSQEQASGIEQVNKAVNSMDHVTQQNAALVEQATAAAQSLNEQAAGLKQLMARFVVDDMAQFGAARGALRPGAPERAGGTRAA